MRDERLFGESIDRQRRGRGPIAARAGAQLLDA